MPSTRSKRSTPEEATSKSLKAAPKKASAKKTSAKKTPSKKSVPKKPPAKKPPAKKKPPSPAAPAKKGVTFAKSAYTAGSNEASYLAGRQAAQQVIDDLRESEEFFSFFDVSDKVVSTVAQLTASLFNVFNVDHAKIIYEFLSKIEKTFDDADAQVSKKLATKGAAASSARLLGQGLDLVDLFPSIEEAKDATSDEFIRDLQALLDDNRANAEFDASDQAKQAFLDNRRLLDIATNEKLWEASLLDSKGDGIVKPVLDLTLRYANEAYAAQVSRPEEALANDPIIQIAAVEVEIPSPIQISRAGIPLEVAKEATDVVTG
jgi:hypothetical protein